MTDTDALEPLSLDGDALDPIGGGGALIGYARVSTRDQNLDRQTRALKASGCKKVFADKKSGKDVEREQLAKCLDYMRAGDTLVVASLDRLGRSLQDLISIVADLRRRGIGFRSLHEALDTTTPRRASGVPCLRRAGRIHS
ncbi:recombinase family protein [Nocardia fusca]